MITEKGAYIELKTELGFKFKQFKNGSFAEETLLDLMSEDLVGYARDIDGTVTLKFFDGQGKQTVVVDDANINFLAIVSRFGGGIIKDNTKSV